MKKVLFCFTISMTCFAMSAQYSVGGNYCPNPVNDVSATGNECFPSNEDKYALAINKLIFNTASSTCEIEQVWADLALHTAGNYQFYRGVHHGNGGQSTYKFYINVDCDSLSEELLVTRNFGSPWLNPMDSCIDVGGINYILLFTSTVCVSIC